MKRETVRRIKSMDRAGMEKFLAALYRIGYKDGYADAVKEIEDEAVILTEDEAKEQFGEEAVERALRGL